MLIRKLYKFENAHIVRNCSTDRCKYNIHGHSYRVEVLLSADGLDNGQMVYDFGLMKGHIKEMIDSFDHSTTIWNLDSDEYKESIKKFSKRWIELPVNPSAEQFSRVIFMICDMIFKMSDFKNSEQNVTLYSVIVHETDTGYAQCFREDIDNPKMGIIDIDDIIFSEQVCNEWSRADLWEEIKKFYFTQK